MEKDNKTVLVRIDPDLKKFLDKQVTFKGESYNQIIRRLIEDRWKVKIPSEVNQEK